MPSSRPLRSPLSPLGGASAALASSDKLPAFTERYNFDDEWCFDQGDYTDCTVSHGDLVVTYTPNVRATARIHFRSNTISYDDATGAEIATSRTTSLDKTVYVDGFQHMTFEVEPQPLRRPCSGTASRRTSS